MTIWLPDLTALSGPRYQAIADALAHDIGCGALMPGTRLPTHRDLAWRLGVTIGTVSRAYAEAERRGLVAGEVGRGTYVRAPDPIAAGPGLAGAETPEVIDFGANAPFGGGEVEALAATLTRLAASPHFAALLRYGPSGGRAADRAAGAAWLARSGLAATAARILPTNGAQHALATIFTALTRPGDTVATECLTYPGMKALAELLGLRLAGLAMDGEGLLPDAFAAACRSGRIAALYTMPTLHNPLGAVMPEARRRAVAEIARRHDVMIVEDDVFGFLLADRPPPICAFAPEHGCFVVSAGKCMVPGLRVGYLHAPDAAVDRLVRAMRATSYMATPLIVAAATRWIEDGTADRFVTAKRRIAASRARLAAALLPGAAQLGHPAASHLLLTLPAAWREEDFIAAARRRGVALSPGAAFAVDGAAASALGAGNAVRLCFGTPASEVEVERGLRVVGELLAGAPEADLSVV